MIGFRVRKYCKEKQPVGNSFQKPAYECRARVSSHLSVHVTDNLEQSKT